MAKLNKDRIICPSCKKTKLLAIKDEDKYLVHICIGGCGAKFRPDYQLDWDNERVLYILEGPPEPIVVLGRSLPEVVKSADSLDREAHRHVVGWMDFTERIWQAGPPPERGPGAASV